MSSKFKYQNDKMPIVGSLHVDPAIFALNAGRNEVTAKYGEHKNILGNVVKDMDLSPDGIGKFEVYEYGSIYVQIEQ